MLDFSTCNLENSSSIAAPEYLVIGRIKLSGGVPAIMQTDITMSNVKIYRIVLLELFKQRYDKFFVVHPGFGLCCMYNVQCTMYYILCTMYSTT